MQVHENKSIMYAYCIESNKMIREEKHIIMLILFVVEILILIRMFYRRGVVLSHECKR